MRIKRFNESNNNKVTTKFIKKITTKSLKPKLITIGIDEDEVDIFCNNNDTVLHYELKIPHDLQMDIEMLLSEYVERGIHGLDVDHDSFPDSAAYWFDFGNGIQSITIGFDELNVSIYNIYSGDSELTELLDELDVILDAKKYNRG